MVDDHAGDGRYKSTHQRGSGHGVNGQTHDCHKERGHDRAASNSIYTTRNTH